VNTRIVARDLAKEAPQSLNERVARFAIAINGCSARAVSKSHWGTYRCEPATIVERATGPAGSDSLRAPA
jgi:hypothetical protein